MNFRFLITISFAFFCVLLLVEEGKEVNVSKASSLFVRKIKASFPTETSNREKTSNLEETNELLSEQLEQYQEELRKANFEVLFCQPLRQIFPNRSELLLDEISDDLLEFFDKAFRNRLHPEINSSETVHQRIARKRNAFESVILEPLKARSYYIVRNRFCLALQRFDLAKPILDELFNSPPYNLLSKDSYNFFSPLKAGKGLELDLVFHHKDPNYNCSPSTSPRSHNECLNDCLKERDRLSGYLYKGSESGVVHLNSRNVTGLKPHRRRCFERCEKHFCVGSAFIRLNGNDSDPSVSVNRFSLIFVIPPLNYWIQLIGLVLPLFFGTCVYKLACKPFHLLFERNKSLLWRSKVAIALFCLVAFFILAQKFVKDYLEKQRHLTFYNPIERLSFPENFNLIICVPVIHSLNRYNVQAFPRSINFPHHLLSQGIENLTFAQLESATNDAFNETVNEIYLQVLDRRSEVSWKLTDKVIFANIFPHLPRCFEVAVNVSETPKYESFLSASKLAISFKHPLYGLFLVPEGQNFHLANYRHNKLVQYAKRVHEFPAESCGEYGREYWKGPSKCNSFFNCLDQCVQQASISRNRNVSAFGLVDKSLFSERQWSGLFPDFSLEEYQKTRSECSKNLTGECSPKTFFFPQPKPEPDFDPNPTVGNVKISYEIDSLTESNPSMLKLIFDLLNVQGI